MKKKIIVAVSILFIIGCFSLTYQKKYSFPDFLFKKENSSMVYGFKASFEKAYNRSELYDQLSEENIKRLFYKEKNDSKNN